VCGFDYDKPTILDDMPKQLSVDEITRMFNSVGFSSPPSWLKPYRVLSNGEKMRVDLARALLSDLDLIVFDEFTSVVDRDVAKIGSFAVQKAARRTDKKFIAVTCHFDVEDWLQPDWVFDTNTMQLRIDKKKSQKSELTYTSAKTKQYGRHLKSIII
jgi:ABC-type ATPase with predicted acetyltransferase domain